MRVEQKVTKFRENKKKTGIEPICQVQGKRDPIPVFL